MFSCFDARFRLFFFTQNHIQVPGTVQHLIVSLKTVSIEGRFETENLMRPDNGPAYSVCAVIDRDPHASQPRMSVADEVVEI